MKARQSEYGNKKNISKSKEEDFRIPESIKKRTIGFLLFLLGILLGIAVITYSSSDQAQLQRIKYPWDLFVLSLQKETVQPGVFVFNYLGLFGAFFADLLVFKFLGYFSISISFILGLIGFSLMKLKPLLKSITVSIYSLLLSFGLASSAGLLILIFGRNSVSRNWSGNTGDFLASFFYRAFGGIGASLILIAIIGLVVFLLIDNNILKTLARLQILWHKIKESFSKEKIELEDKLKQKTDAKIIKNALKEEKKSSAGIEDSLSEKLKQERDRIQALRNKVADEESPVIKETEIKRPKLPEELKIPPIDAVNPEQLKKKKSQKENKELPLEDLLTTSSLKDDISETDINPNNANMMDDMTGVDEDDFIEETLDDYKKPVLELLIEQSKDDFEYISDEELNQNGRLLQEKLLNFGIVIEKVFATPGPVVTLYELIPAPDVKLSKIESLQDDIALAMKAKGIRMIIPIPGKGTVGVEIPNKKSSMVRVKSILSTQKFKDYKGHLPVAFGKTIEDEVFIDDLAKMPHVLIAGATGSGKSVGINTILASLLYRMKPEDLKLVLIDPKKIELSLYSKLRRHFIATTTDINESIVTSSSNAVSILKSLESEMEIRYSKLANAGVRSIDAYNEKHSKKLLKDTDSIRHRKMPYIVVVIDELADLMITAKRDIEDPIARIAQMARAVGIHLVVATQRPSVDVITGVIKANFPVRIAYQVASKIDSRTILDMGGADQLLRNGDMLFLSSSQSKPVRIQNAYISTEECEKIVDFISDQKGFSKPYLLPSLVERRLGNGIFDEERDEMFEEAVRLVLKLQLCSTSTLQRRLKLGYARAARIVDQMEAAGIVGPNQGAKGREILLSEDEIDEIL